MEIQQAARLALLTGEILLGNGAETYRIEETVASVCRLYGFEGECLALSNGIVINLSAPGTAAYTCMTKAEEKRVDLYRIELTNAFARDSENGLLSFEQAQKKLLAIKNSITFSYFVRVFAACMTGLIYTLFFGGTWADCTAAAVVCCAVYVLLQGIQHIGLFGFLQNFLAGLLIGFGSLAAAWLPFGVQTHNVITGCIMILIPGVVLTNGVKDIMYGNFAAGVSKFFEALMVIAAVG
ncbi:MAG: threonine/serine exporter family protein, partial [Oscillospiraceae bacterium]|nr:threonine/serine exporter family protein [Oscillospiraceae bacterium]